MIPAKGNAQCFKLWGLTCQYRTADPSVPYDLIIILCVIICITGVNAAARFCKVSGLTCHYKTADPSVPYDVIIILCVIICITGVKAGAQCCKVSGLKCDYKTAGPSFPFDGAMAEARCDAGALALGEFLMK